MKFVVSNKVVIYIILLLLVFSCNKEPINNYDCPNFQNYPFSPYSHPIMHPSGELIGFNHIPIKEIIYHYGYECPLQAMHIYDDSKAGFWLADPDGSNMRRVLPYYLYNSSWSPDGKSIVFSNGNVCTIPFDGGNFDTTNIKVLSNTGHDFYPCWSRNGEYIAYDNTECGSALYPPPENGCGILITDPEGYEKEFIIERRRFPYWGPSNDTIYYGLFYYDLVNKVETTILNTDSMDFWVRSRPFYHPTKRSIYFKAKYVYTQDHFSLYSIDPSGKDLRIILDEPFDSFSFTHDGKILYVPFDGSRIDDCSGTIWIMNDDGSNKKQLTTNTFTYSIN